MFTFLAAITLLTVTPGLDTLLVIRNAARGGWQDGVVSSLGICCGLFVHATISAVGISLILLQTAWLFNTLKFAGACYLVWLGISNWRNLGSGISSMLRVQPCTEGGTFDITRSFREGFLSNVLNPKTAVFYMAFLPHFIDPLGSAMMQSLLLAGLHFLVAMAWQSCLAFSVSRARSWLQKPGVNRWFGAVTGTVFILLGFRLALED